MNTENITRVRRLDLNTVLYSGSAYQSQGSSAAGHWITDSISQFTYVSRSIYLQILSFLVKKYLDGLFTLNEQILRDFGGYTIK